MTENKKELLEMKYRIAKPKISKGLQNKWEQKGKAMEERDEVRRSVQVVPLLALGAVDCEPKCQKRRNYQRNNKM